ncbi:MAG: hypothetical protein EPO08_09130 [Rhodospirillaceae bacterium]|nr:MAG: hypothetical protein EPO08_09130 [Rhodospirillaceae bacterium]
MDISEWPKFLEQRIASLPAAVMTAAHEGVEIAAEIARDKIGEYQGAIGSFPAWAPLATSTVEEKTRLGYAPPDNPLLRTGELRDSIGTSVERAVPTASVVAIVGSTSPIARYQEIGTTYIPPRPFIGPAMLEAEPAIADGLGTALHVAASGESRSPRAFRRAAE